MQQFIGYTHTYETAIAVKPKALNRLSTIQNEIQKKISSSSSSSSLTSNSTDDNNTTTPIDEQDGGLEKVLSNAYSGYTQSQENHAHRIYITISRDLLQLEPQAYIYIYIYSYIYIHTYNHTHLYSYIHIIINKYNHKITSLRHVVLQLPRLNC